MANTSLSKCLHESTRETENQLYVLLINNSVLFAASKDVISEEWEVFQEAWGYDGKRNCHREGTWAQAANGAGWTGA